MTAKKAQLFSDEQGFQAYLNDARKSLDLQLQLLKPFVDRLRVGDRVEYVLRTRGKQLRYDLVLLAGESVGGAREELQTLALAVELLHTASLVHDDVLDRDLFRRNAFSVQAKWGVREAVLVGDVLASLALVLCRGYRPEILDLMVNTCLQLSDGEYMDLETSQNVFSEEEYMVRVRKKTSSLFRAAAECGALAAKGTPEEVEALGVFGENYGVAFQIRDDLLDGADSEEFRVTLPIIRFYQGAGRRDRFFLENLVKKRRTRGSAKDEAQGNLNMKLKEGDAFPYCARKIERQIDEAVAALGSLRESPLRGYLRQMAESLRAVQPT